MDFSFNMLISIVSFFFNLICLCADPRIAMVRSNPLLARALLSVLHEVYWSSAGPAVRSQALKAILRCVYYADAQLLRQVLKMQVSKLFFYLILTYTNDHNP